jgi:nucleoside-diphosphate-sugar epimerase
MRIFTTGATGFIGGHFVRAALAKGHDVLALRRDGSASRVSLPQEPQWVIGDLRTDCRAVLSGCEVLVHFAAVGMDNTAGADWEECFRVNVRDSRFFWEQAIDSGVKHLVICGSCYEYGRSGASYAFIPPNAPLFPTGDYHASKAAATMAAMALATVRKTSLSVLRPFHVFGEGASTNSFWTGLKHAAENGEDFAMTQGEQVFDFTPVEEVAERFLHFCEKLPALPRGIRMANVGSGSPQKLSLFAEHWWNAFSARGALKFGAIPYRKNETMRMVPALGIEHFSSL